MANVLPLGADGQLAPGVNVAKLRHPLHEYFFDEWTKLQHVRHGTGGFLDGTYLVAHPREWKDHTATNPVTPTKKLLARRNLARYDPLASAILEAKKAALFRQAPTRRTKGETPKEIEAWWNDVDGHGCAIDELMPEWWDLAATFGHIALYFELPATEPPDTAADQNAPYVRVYSPLDIVNWLEDDNGNLTSVMFVEGVQPDNYAEAKTARQVRYRIVDSEKWQLTYPYSIGARYSRIQRDSGQQGVIAEEGEHKLGRLPVTFLYGKRMAMFRNIGESVLGPSSLYIDLFNLTSEDRELIRNQAFSVINAPLGTGVDAVNVEQAQSWLGEQTGTMNVLFSALPMQILSGDSSNIEAVQKEIQQLKRDIYRVAGVPWESDSRDAESGDSMRIRREELNTRLSQYGNECQKAERDLVDLWYRWRYGADQGPSQADTDDATVIYPDTFDAAPFEELIQQIQAATDVRMPAEFLKELRKALLPKFEGMGTIEEDLKNRLNAAIDAAEDDPDPAERVRLMDAALRKRTNAEEDGTGAEGDGEEEGLARRAS